MDGLTNPINRRRGLKLVAAAMALWPSQTPAFAENAANGNVAVRKLEVERFSLTSSKPFEAILSAIKAAVGKPDMTKFREAAGSLQSFAEFERLVQQGLGPTGLMLFAEYDEGSVLRRESGLANPKIVRLLIGNPLIMKEMAKHVPDACSYAPVTVLVDERPDGVHLSYDRMASLLGPYGSAQALTVARDLDAKIETLLKQSAS